MVKAGSIWSMDMAHFHIFCPHETSHWFSPSFASAELPEQGRFQASSRICTDFSDHQQLLRLTFPSWSMWSRSSLLMLSSGLSQRQDGARLRYTELPTFLEFFIPEGLKGLFRHPTVLPMQPVNGRALLPNGSHLRGDPARRLPAHGISMQV